jgi:4-hydroxy-4-methyl-2-oxoglutarate aldolase
MPALLTTAEIEELKKFSSPSISNGIETFNVRPRNMGFLSYDIKCMFPDMPPMVGYAFTVRMRAEFEAKQPPDINAYRRAVLAASGPKVLVLQDEDEKPVGSFWGEVNANIHRALGCVGTVTDGGVRDLNEVRALDFHFFARTVLVSHAYVHVRGWGEPVHIGGMTIRPGDLMHADRHGIVLIPQEIARDLAAATAEVERKERIVIAACQAPDFSLEKLDAAYKQMRAY